MKRKKIGDEINCKIKQNKLKKVAVFTSTATQPNPLLRKHAYKVKRKKKINTRSSWDECRTDVFFSSIFIREGTILIMSTEH